MSKKENKFREYDISTQAIHTGTDYDEGTGAVRRPLHIVTYKPKFISSPYLLVSRLGGPNKGKERTALEKP